MKNKKIISIMLLISMMLTLFTTPASACTDKAGESYVLCNNTCYIVICYTHNIQYAEVHGYGCGCSYGHQPSRCGVCGVKECCGEGHNACSHGSCGHSCKTHHTNHCNVCHSTEHIHGYSCNPCNHSCKTHHADHCLTCHTQPCSCYPSASIITIQDGFSADNITVTATNDTATSHKLYDENYSLVTEVGGKESQFTITENGTYYITPLNQSGENPNKQQVIIDKIDRENPVVDKVEVSEVWSNKAVPATVTAFDSLSGVWEYGYGKNAGNINWQASSILELPDNGEYVAYAKDKVGNVSHEYPFSISYIDKILPTASHNITPEIFTQSEVTINVNATDNQSGIETITNPMNESSNEYIVKENGDYLFVAYDKAGNRLEYIVTISNVDKTAPEYLFTLDTEGFANKGITITVTGKDSQSGVKTITLQDGSVINGDTVSFLAQVNDDYLFIFSDAAGNSSELVVTIDKIDTVAPTVTHALSNFEFTNETVDIIISSEDDLSKIEKIVLPDGTEVQKDTAKVTVLENGEYSFLVYDVAGNVTEHIVEVSNIDKTPPSIAYKLNTEEWTNKDMTIYIFAKDKLSGVEKVILPNRQEITDLSKTAIEYSAKENATYSFTAVDKVGNIVIKDIEISNIDTIKPTATLIKAVDNWVKDGVDITIEATDNDSKIKEITLPDGSKVNSNNAIFKAEENKKYIFKVLDNAGNSESFALSIDKIENELPTPPYIEDISDKKLLEKAIFDKNDYLVFPWTNKDLTLTFASKAQSEISRIEYSLNSGEWTPLKEKSLTFSKEGIHSFIIRSVSNAGSLSQTTKYTVRIDKTLPSHELVQLKNKVTVYGKDNLSGVESIACDCSSTDKEYITCKLLVGDNKHRYTLTDKSGNVCEFVGEISVVEELSGFEETFNSVPKNSFMQNLFRYMILPIVAILLGFIWWFILLFLKRRKEEEEEE